MTLLRSLPGAAAPRPPVFQKEMPRADWRDNKKVTAAKNQGQCASCWDFAAVAAFESAYLITNQETADLSEQRVLDCNEANYDCQGGWPDAVFDYLVHSGDVDAKAYRGYQVPFIGRGKCETAALIPYVADTWGYVGVSSAAFDDSHLVAPTNEQLKQALCEHGPIAVGVSSDGWDGYCKAFPDHTPNPNWAKDYPNGVFLSGQPSVPQLTDPTPSQLDHVVLLIGWDNSLGPHGAWLIKNSWGTEWGEDGFMKLAYDTANLGFGAVWVKARATAPSAYTAETLNRLQSINLGRW